YFLCMALAIEDRRRHERALLGHYLDARTRRGGAAIGFDEAWRAHRLHAAYTVVASCQIVTFPENASPARRVFSAAFLARPAPATAARGGAAALRGAACGGGPAPGARPGRARRRLHQRHEPALRVALDLAGDAERRARPGLVARERPAQPVP